MTLYRAVNFALCCSRGVACRFCCLPLTCTQQVYFRCLQAACSIQSTSPQTTQHNPEVVPFYLQSFANDSVEKVLRSARNKTLELTTSVQLLKALRVQVLLKKADLSDFQNNNDFKRLCETFVTGCCKLEPSMVVSGLRSLLIIGLDCSNSYVECIERTILSNVQEFKSVDLISCLHLHSKYCQTTLQKAVAAALTEEIQIRGFDLATPSEALMLVQLVHLFERSQLRQLEDKLVGVVGQMSTQEAVKCLSCLAEQSFRAKSLLKELSALLISRSKPSIKDTVTILFSAMELNFFDSELLYFVTEDRDADVAEVKQPSQMSALLTSLGQLKWRHSALLESCCQWLSSNLKSCSARELVSFLLTFASLCYVPNDKSLLHHVTSLLKAKDIDAKVWLDAVWASAVLDCVNKENLLHAVSSEFHLSLTGSSDKLPLQSKLKLMNLMTVLKYKHPECIFSCDLFLDMDGVSRSQKAEKCKGEVLTVLKSFIPQGTCLAINLSTNMGIVIDAEFIVDKSGKPLPLSEYGLKAKPTVVMKPLPSGASRIALMVWLHSDFTLNERILTGGNALAVRLLQMEGYTVLQVPYDIFCKNRTAVAKAKYLANLIKSNLGI